MTAPISTPLTDDREIAANNEAIFLRGLRKSFGTQTVLDGIDLTVRTGSIFALLGENGAGKTTTIRILTTLLQPDGGSASIHGVNVVEDAAQARNLFTLAGQFAAVDDLLTGRENLQMMARLRRQPQPGTLATDLLERFDLTAAADKRVSTWSGGMRRRLDLAMSLIGSPRVIFLDEPTTGLDPQGRRTIWQMVRAMASAGATIFLTTQYLEEAEVLADEVAILKNGRVIAQGSPAALKQQFPGGFVEIALASEIDLARAVRVIDSIALRVDRDNLMLTIATDGTVGAVKRLLDTVADEEIELASLAVRQPTLEEVFMSLTAPQEEQVAP